MKILKNTLIVGSMINFTAKIFSFLANYLTMILIIKLFGIGYYGNFNLTLSVIGILSTIILFGTDTFALKEVSKGLKREDIKRLINKLILIIFIIALFLYILIFIVSLNNGINSYLKKNSISLYWILILVPFVAINNLFLSVIRGMKSIIFYSIGEKLIQRSLILLILTVIFLARSGINVNLLCGFGTVGAFLYSIIVYYNLLKGYSTVKNFKLYFNIIEILKNVQFTFFSSIILMLLGWMDTLLLSYFKNSSIVGAYNVAVQLSILINFAMSSINGILSPTISKFYFENNIVKLERNLKQANKIIFFSSLLLSLILIIFSKEFLSVIGISSHVNTTLIILIIGQLCCSMMGSVVNLLNMSGYFKEVTFAMIIALIVNLTLNLLLIPKFGMMGAAIATSTSLVTRDLICTLFARKIFLFKFSIFQ